MDFIEMVLGILAYVRIDAAISSTGPMRKLRLRGLWTMCPLAGRWKIGGLDTVCSKRANSKEQTRKVWLERAECVCVCVGGGCPFVLGHQALESPNSLISRPQTLQATFLLGPEFFLLF
jgi:hypothetical protein